MSIFLRVAEVNDSNIFFNWVNKQDSLNIKIENKDKIDFGKHNKWFLERLKDSNTYIWVIEDSRKDALGQIRFQKKDNFYFDVDIYIISTFRLKGIALKGLKMAINKVKNLPLRAIVKKNNVGSIKLFTRCGFLIQSDDRLKWILVKN